ncbi:MAG: methionyl-tRNA formyltransferase [Patescibacteria group bacterium]|nr:methionyl-tRNA formyltransferase [Patescibacteria group bacterium]
MNNFIFFGTSNFSKIVLEELINYNYLPSALITNPDKPIGRNKIITPPPTKELIFQKKLNSQVKILQPEKIDQNLINDIKNIKPEFGIICAYSKIIPVEILNIFPKGILGIHPSLLPKYRGPSPIQSSILVGEKESGTTIYLVDEKMDHGPILIQKKCLIEDLYYEEANKKLAQLSAEALLEILPKFLNNQIKTYKQDENLATYTKKFKTEDGFIDFKDIIEAENNGGDKAFKIYNKIRALNIEPGVWTLINNKRLKIFEAQIVDNKIQITKIQFAGQKIKNINYPLSKLK